MVNNQIPIKIHPRRGLRQDDPLSPYLFVLCAQGLSSTLSKAAELRKFNGVKIAASSPSVSHLFFADDSLIFFKATKKDCENVRNCLHSYASASGQLINYDNLPSRSVRVLRLCQLRKSGEYWMWMLLRGMNFTWALPTFSLRSKRLQFAYIRERISKKIQGWRSKFFSMGGREVLIKSVLQAIPSFAMSCFKLPTSLCHEIERTCAKFWWGNNRESKSMHWLNWNDLCKPKCFGWMRFRNMVAFNKALVAKQVWRVVQKPESLMARILKAGYFKHSDIMDAGLGSNPSFVWRSFLWGRELLSKGLCSRVGTGEKISAKLDPWIPGLSSFRCNNNTLLDGNLKVTSFISPNGSWYNSIIRQIFSRPEVEAILDIPLNRRGCTDIRYWHESSNGKYSVRDGYRLEANSFAPPPSQSSHSLHLWWKAIWQLHVPPKIRIFMWRASRDFLPTSANLQSHHVPIDGRCPLCNFNYASTSHCLLFCSFVKKAWKNTIFWSYLCKLKECSFVDCGLLILKTCGKEEFEVFAIVSWAIWSDLCKLLHAPKLLQVDIEVGWAFSLLGTFRMASESCKVLPMQKQIIADSRWKRPTIGQVRLDVDAGWDEANNLFSVGAVIRDSHGLLLGAKAKLVRNRGSIKGAELESIRFGMDYCVAQQFANVYIFSDSLQAVHAVTKPEEELGSVGALALEIHFMLHENNFLSIHHIKRSANREAHLLAHKALILLSNLDWVTCGFPTWLLKAVEHDLSLTS